MHSPWRGPAGGGGGASGNNAPPGWYTVAGYVHNDRGDLVPGLVSYHEGDYSGKGDKDGKCFHCMKKEKREYNYCAEYPWECHGAVNVPGGATGSPGLVYPANPVLSRVLSAHAESVDKVALAITAGGFVFTNGSALGEGLVGLGACSPGVVAGVGCFAAGALNGKVAAELALAGSPVGTLENVLGGLSLAMTFGADLTGGNTGYDPYTQEVVIGQSTIVSLSTAALGMVPESDLDFAAQVYQVWWDENAVPVTQLRIGSNGLYFRSLP
jgi:hypothetical protein